MPIVLTTVIVIALVALFAAPALAARFGAPPVAARATTVAAVDAFIKLDSLIKGEIKLDLSYSKLADKWRVTSLKCDDVTVVATGPQGVVATGKATPGSDPATCVYSLKIPSGESLSIYANIGSPQSVGITGWHKLSDGTYQKVPTTSDLKTESYVKYDGIKGDLQTVKLAPNGSQTLPLYIKLSS